MRRGAALVLTAGLCLVAACERYVAVGHEDALSTAGGQPPWNEAGGPSLEPSGDIAGGHGGAPPAGDAGAAGDAAAPAGAGGESGAELWSADHETSTFEQWLGDGAGVRFVEGSGQLSLTTEQARSGRNAFVASISADDGAQHQAAMGRELKLRDGRYGAWYYLPVAPRADYWVIMKLSNGRLVDRFDIDIEALAGGEPHLRLYEHDDGWITPASPLKFPLQRWVHVEALYRSTAEADGRLIVLQDGQIVLDTGPRATASDDHVAFLCGSASRYVSPAPYRLFIDDASIRAAALP